MYTVLAIMTMLSGVLVIYHHALYPVFLGILARRGDRDERRHDYCSGIVLPRVAIVVPAYNEAMVIADKVRNLAALDYPDDLLEVVIVCDGCTDGTAARARSAAGEPPCRHLRIEIRETEVNRGKRSIVNEVVPELHADLVGLSDASALISIDAVRLAADHFMDHRVGVVCGTYRLLNPASDGEEAYWNYQVEIKKREAAIGATIGAHGAFYMFRRDLFETLPANAINDDFILPMSIVLAGHRSVYEPQIVAVELERSPPEMDLRRRRRIAAGNLQQLVLLHRLLHPRYGSTAFVFASGKALRSVMPLLLIISLLGSLILAPQSTFFAAAAAAQATIYILALLRHAAPEFAWPKPIEAIHYMVSGHLAGLVGATRYLLGLEGRGWDGASRWAAPAVLEGRGAIGPAKGVQSEVRSNLAGSGDGGTYGNVGVTIVKRAMDVLVATTLLATMAPLLLLIALAIRLDSPGPALFRQMRIGQSTPIFTKLFWIIKFRTMTTEVGAIPAAVWAAEDDPRITRVGRFLRRSRLDELPQLINVLRGEMSLIGPRPEQPAISRWLVSAIPFYSERLYGLRPGITGFAQVHQGYDRDLDDVRTKLSYDHAYAVALSSPRAWLALELRIIARTALVMAKGWGR